VSGLVRQCRINVCSYSEWSALCRDLFDEMGNCRYAFGEDGIMSGLVRQGHFLFWDLIGEDWFVSGHVRRSRLIVGRYPAKSVIFGT